MSPARPQPTETKTAAAPLSFGRLARRISAWTSNLLATALVLVIGLGVGRQVVRWWSADAEAPQADEVARAAQGLGNDRLWHILEFGERPGALRQKSLPGDATAAQQALRAACRDVLTSRETSPMRQRGTSRGNAAAPGPAELRFLKSTSGLQPAEQSAGWQLYEFAGPFPLAAGIVADPVRRVLVWGMAMPASDDAWKLYVFEPAAAAADSASPDVPLPDGCRRTLAVRQPSGGALLAFRDDSAQGDTDRAQAWRRFYDNRLPARGWQAEGVWQGGPAAGSRRYRRVRDGRREWVDVQFGPDGHGSLAGVLSISQSQAKDRTP